MTTFLRREKALACPIHTAIKTEAARRLEHAGVFSKEEVLGALGFDAVADAIRWDYVREFLEDEQGCELIPLAAAYFTRHAYRAETHKPEKFIAQGYGKKTAGFAAVIPKNDHLVIRRVKQRKNLANGAGEAFRKYLDAINARRAGFGLSNSETALVEGPPSASDGLPKRLTPAELSADGDSLIA